MNTVDNSYLQTLGIEPVAGRLFSSQFPGDTNFRIILNERSVREMGFASPQEAVGKNVGIDFQGQTYRLEVVGVVKDFHFKDLHEDIEPYGFQLNDENFNYLIAHTREGQVGHVLQAVQKTWNQLNPNEPFEYSFLDEDFARNYVAEERLSAIVKYFTLIAIFISCLVFDPYQYDQADGHTQGQAKDVDEGKQFVPSKISDRYFNEVEKHRY